MSVHRRGLRMPANRFESLSVKAGILADATYPADVLKNAKTGETKPDPRAGMKVAAIAAALNYGTRQNHPRPFMEQTIAREAAKWIKNVSILLAARRPGREVMAIVGQTMKEDIQFTISEWPADNSPEWAEFKGFNHGLVLSGHLLKSVDYDIEAKGSNGEAL